MTSRAIRLGDIDLGVAGGAENLAIEDAQEIFEKIQYGRERITREILEAALRKADRERGLAGLGLRLLDAGGRLMSINQHGRALFGVDEAHGVANTAVKTCAT